MNKLLSLFFISVLYSCGNPSNPSNVVYVDNYERALEKLNESSVACPSGSCPSFAGKITTVINHNGQYSVSVCSATLISEDTIMTNSHCIDDIIQPANSCSETLRIQFPQTNTHIAEEAMCDEIVTNLAKGHFFRDPAIDIAIIKLNQRMNRNPVRIGVADTSSQTIHSSYVMNPQMNIMIGLIEEKKFSIAGNNFLIYSQQNLTSPKALFLTHQQNSHKVISGNSGSGLLNARGELVGVIKSTFATKDVRKIFNRQGYNVPDINLEYDLGIATNIKCAFSSTLSQSPDCHESIQSFLEQVSESEGFRKYIQRKLITTGLTHLAQDKIGYEIENDLQLKLFPLNSPGSSEILPVNSSSAPSNLANSTSAHTLLRLIQKLGIRL
jgi:hypothetical protein